MSSDSSRGELRLFVEPVGSEDEAPREVSQLEVMAACGGSCLVVLVIHPSEDGGRIVRGEGDQYLAAST